MPNPDFHQQLFNTHSGYIEKSITHRRFKHHDLVPLLDKLRGKPGFEVTTIGKSFQGRDIFMVKVGTGKTKVLLWSQMHGNEATATMAMLDIFNYLASPQPPPKEGELDAASRNKGNIKDAFLADPVLYPLLKTFVKEHRSKPTEAESVLWNALRGRKLDNYKFRRQYIIGSYIADFVCLEKRLVIELDGLIHQLPEYKLADEERTQWLNQKGYKVIRFTNKEILGNFEFTLDSIGNALSSPSFGGGWGEALSLFFVPMLNPDGAEVFERRTAQGIDMNRDALRLQCPESQLLKRLQNELKPDYGFNLHDQDIRYTAGKSPLPATISLLAPPTDDRQTVNGTRQKAMQVIVQLNRHLQELIPGQVGRWPDDFEPRAFGENMQQWGTSTILVESGGYANDPEKQFIRKLNFVLLLDAFQQIDSQSFANQKLDEYYAIPVNEKYLFDLLIRNVKTGNSVVDIGINRTEKNIGTTAGFYHNGQIDDWGDLSVFHGYQELDAQNLQLVEGKLHPGPALTSGGLEKTDIGDLLKQGYLAVRIADASLKKQPGLAFPIHTVLSGETFEPKVGEGRAANFLLSENGVIRYAVVNGFLHDLRR